MPEEHSWKEEELKNKEDKNRKPEEELKNSIEFKYSNNRNLEEELKRSIGYNYRDSNKKEEELKRGLNKKEEEHNRLFNSHSHSRTITQLVVWLQEQRLEHLLEDQLEPL